MTANAYIYQIYYDDASFASLDPGFLPLDNRANERPDWYEFWPIRKFLMNNPIDDQSFYGFFSPKFITKTGLSFPHVDGFVKHWADSADVILISHGWDQLSYFQNVFEQGEDWHPGFFELAEDFFKQIGVAIDLKTLVTHTLTSTFSNYMIAKGRFWREWLQLGNALFELLEDKSTPFAQAVASHQSFYPGHGRFAPTQTFLQERIAPVLLASGGYTVASPDMSAFIPIYEGIFVNDLGNKRALHACDLLKQQYLASGDEDYLRVFKKLRRTVRATRPLATILG